MTDDELLAALDESLPEVSVSCTDSPDPVRVPECGLPASVLVETHPFGVCGGDRNLFVWTTLCQRHFDEIRAMCEQVRDEAARRRKGVAGGFATPFVHCHVCGRRFSPDDVLRGPQPVSGGGE